MHRWIVDPLHSLTLGLTRDQRLLISRPILCCLGMVRANLIYGLG